MQILTPTGYKNVTTLSVGDEVSAFDQFTGAPIVNHITSLESVLDFEYRERTHNPSAPFNFYKINGSTELFQDQSIWRDGVVVHASELNVGDTIFDDTDNPITISSIEMVDGYSFWWRIEIDGDHSYIADGVTLHNASRFWVGDTGTWDGSSTARWSGSSGGSSGSSVPGSSDTVTFDANSFLSSGTCTVNTNFSITTLSWGTSTGTIDFSINNNSPTMTTFNGSGTSTRSMKLGSGTFSVTGSGSSNQWQMGTVTNLTWNAGTSTINFTYSGSVGTRTISPGTALVYYNVSISAGTDIVSIGNSSTYNNLSFAGFSGSTNAFTSTFTLLGNVTFGTGMTIPSGTGTFIFAGTSGTQTLTCNGVQFNHPVTVNNPGATLQLADALDTTGANARTFTLTAGTFDTTGKTWTIDIFAGSNSNVRTLTLGASVINVIGSATTIWSLATSTNMTLNAGTSTINFTYSGGTGTRTIGLGTTLTYNDINISAGSDTFACTGNGTIAHTVSFSGFTGTNSSFATIGLTGSWTSGSGMTATSVSNSITFQATSGTQTFTSNGVQMNRPITVNAVGATVQIADAMNIDGASTRLLTLTAGTFDANNKTVTIGGFTSSNSNTRVLTMGTAQWTLTGSGTTIWSQSTATNMTINFGTLPVLCNYSGSTGTRTLQTGQISVQPESQAVSFSFSAGTDTIAFTGTSRTYKSIDFTGFGGTWTTTASQNIFGDLTLSATMTASLTGALAMRATSGTKTLTTNGNTTITTGMTFDGVGGTFQLGDAFSGTGTFTVTNGTFTTNNKNLTASAVSSANTNTRTITLGSSTITLNGTGVVWDTSTTTGLTFNKGTATIRLNESTSASKTFAGGALTFNNLTLGGTGTGVFIIGTTTTTMGIDNWVIETPPHTVQIFAGKTIAIGTGNLKWNGTVGNINTIQSTTNGQPWYITSSGIVSEDYISLQDSQASGGASFFAGNHSTDATGNTGWIFTSPVLGKSLKYTIKAPVGMTKAMIYDVKRTPTALTKSLRYAIKVLHALTKSLAYDLKTTPKLTKGLIYDVRSLTALTKSEKYTVITHTSQTKAMVYDVRRTPTALTKSMVYKVRATKSTLQLAMKYEIKDTNALTKSMRYTVHAEPAALTKQLEYYILRGDIINLDLEYQVRRYPYTQADSPYTASTLRPYTPWRR